MVLLQPLTGIVNKVVITLAGLGLDQAPEAPHEMRDGHIRQRSFVQLAFDS